MQYSRPSQHFPWICPTKHLGHWYLLQWNRKSMLLLPDRLRPWEKKTHRLMKLEIHDKKIFESKIRCNSWLDREKLLLKDIWMIFRLNLSTHCFCSQTEQKTQRNHTNCHFGTHFNKINLATNNSNVNRVTNSFKLIPAVGLCWCFIRNSFDKKFAINCIFIISSSSGTIVWFQLIFILKKRIFVPSQYSV